MNERTTVCLSIHVLKDILVVFALGNYEKAAINILIEVFMRTKVFKSVG